MDSPTLKEAVGNYILAKIKLTECMQENFRQVCHVCKKYARCKTYNHYVDCWMKLQEVFLGEE